MGLGQLVRRFIVQDELGNLVTTTDLGGGKRGLDVNATLVGGSSVTHVDDASFTPATDDGVPIFGFFDDAAPDSVDEGDAGVLRMSANRNLYMRIRDNAGNERGANVTASGELNVLSSAQPGVDIGDVTINNASGGAAVNIQDGGNSITVDGAVSISALPDEGQQTMANSISVAIASDQSAIPITGTVTVNEPVSVTTNSEKDEDAGHVSGATGQFILGVRNDLLATTLTSTDGDYSPIAVNSTGQLSTISEKQHNTATGLNDYGVQVMAVRNDNAATSLTTGDLRHSEIACDIKGRVYVDGSTVTQPISGTVTADQGDPNTTANRWPVQITDGTDLALVTSAGELNVLATAQPGVDIGDVTVNNAAGASAVNIQDGGNSITVDNTVLSVVGGGTEATAQRVTIASDSTGVLSVDDNGSSLTIDNSTLAVVGGGTEATALRVTIATDSTGVLSVDDNGSTLSIDDGAGSITVDNTVLSVVGGGTEATAQRVTIANDSTGVLSVDDNGASLTIDNAALSVTGGGTEASALRVTIANNSTGVLSVDDNGGSLTIDGSVSVAGDIAHDSADSGNPVKIGGKAYDLDPSSDGTEPGPSDVVANDRTNFITDLKGGQVCIGTMMWVSPTNVSTTYDDSPTTATSDAFEIWKYRDFTISYLLDKANTPTDITIQVQISNDNSTWRKLTNDALGSLVYDDTSVGSGLDEAYSFRTVARMMRIVVTATGTDATNTFTIADLEIAMGY